MEGLFLEHNQVKKAIAPQDAVGGATGNRVSVKKCRKVAFIVELGAGDGATIQLTARQHDAASGGNSKDLEVKANVYYKLDSDSAFTKIEKRPDDASPSALVDLSTEIAANAGTIVIEVLDEHLDVENGYDHVSIDMGATGGTNKFASASMVARELAHKPAYKEIV